MSSDATPLTYASAGVSLDAANDVVDQLRPALARASRPEVLGSIGGFGGLFQLDLTGRTNPVLVSSTDGVGTKLDLAARLDMLDGVGEDLVAMVVDDLVVTGAEPLFFNDYVSVGVLDPGKVARIVTGIANGCAKANCALVGGETAEHPGVLDDDAFDIAGFAVGVVEKDDILGPERVTAGDVLIGMASSGPHSNGYSLIRRIVERTDLSVDHVGTGRSLGEDLLDPTAIYATSCLQLVADAEVHAMCHVTGGGLPDNLPRVLPEGLAVTIDANSWTVPPVFDWLQQAGPVERCEMWNVFNMGVGMIAVVPPDAVDAALASLKKSGEDAWVMGTVIDHADGSPRVTGLDS